MHGGEAAMNNLIYISEYLHTYHDLHKSDYIVFVQSDNENIYFKVLFNSKLS